MGEGFFIEAHSDTPQTLFENIARQLFSRLTPSQEIGTTLREKIAVEGESLQHLLRNWVDALLDIVRDQKLVFSHFRITGFQMPGKGTYNLQAEALGEHWDPQRHPLHPDTPWLACRKASLRKEGTEYLAEVVLNK